MPRPDTSSQRKGSYPIEAENAAEMGRLSRQSRIATQVLGGHVPHTLDLSQFHHVLDVACGPGTWALDVAQDYPQTQVTGFDISRLMVDYANSIAAIEEQHNAHFRVMDATQPLDFSDNAFDLVHIRFVSGFMPASKWPMLLLECRRVLCPGGVLVMTESELPISTSQTLEYLHRIMAQAFHLAGQGFSPDGRHLGITPMMGRLIRDANFQQIHHIGYANDLSIGTDLHRDYFYPNQVTVFRLVQPFLVQAGVIKQQEIERLYEQMLEEIQDDDFRAISYVVTVWGKKG